MMEMIISIPLSAHIWAKQRPRHVFDSKLPEIFSNISDSFPEGKNINKRRERKTAPMVVEAEVHEKYYSEIETDSEESDYEISDEDLFLDRESGSS